MSLWTSCKRVVDANMYWHALLISLVKTNLDTNMSVRITRHNVSGKGNNCFYRAIFHILARSRLWVELGCDTHDEREGVKFLRRKVADLIRTSAKATSMVRALVELAQAGWIEPDTIMDEYTKMYSNSYLKDTLAQTLERFAQIITTKEVMTDSLDFGMMNIWLNQFDVALINVTKVNAASSKNMTELLSTDEATKQQHVICVSTDNVHYNWVSFEYKTSKGSKKEVVINREVLLKLLTAGNPQVESRQHADAVVQSSYFSNEAGGNHSSFSKLHLSSQISKKTGGKRSHTCFHHNLGRKIYVKNSNSAN